VKVARKLEKTKGVGNCPSNVVELICVKIGVVPFATYSLHLLQKNDSFDN
jgi:hypothetical protein